MARRSNGEGSFYQQKDKSWVYQVTYGRKEDGSPYRKAFKGRTKTICKERRAQWEEEQARIKASSRPSKSKQSAAFGASNASCEQEQAEYEAWEREQAELKKKRAASTAALVLFGAAKANVMPLLV